MSPLPQTKKAGKREYFINNNPGVKGTVKLSVIVCTHNRCDELMRTLDSLASQDYPVSDYEVVVVVGEFIRKYPPLPPLKKGGNKKR